MLTYNTNHVLHRMHKFAINLSRFHYSVSEMLSAGCLDENVRIHWSLEWPSILLFGKVGIAVNINITGIAFYSPII